MEEKEKQNTVTKDLEIENMREFLLENQDIKLENLPRYEDLIQPTSMQDVKLDNLQEVNNMPLFELNAKPKEQAPIKSMHQKRFKIAVSCFVVIGVLLLSLVAINGVTLAILQKDIKDNQKDITSITQEVNELQGDFDATLGEEAEKMGYKLAYPRNYPDDTSELTWFDKLSIFLMKLFG